MSILKASEIKALAEEYQAKYGAPFIDPFVDFGAEMPANCLSYGLSHSGYDLRCSRKFTYTANKGELVDVFNLNNIKYITVEADYFDIEPGDTILSCSVEYIRMPDDLFALCICKSTYARLGINVNCTPIEAGCEAQIVIEIANISHNKVRIYANQGIAQLIFFRLSGPTFTYKDKKGKYFGQKGIQIAKP